MKIVTNAPLYGTMTKWPSIAFKSARSVITLCGESMMGRGSAESAATR